MLYFILNIHALIVVVYTLVNLKTICIQFFLLIKIFVLV
jgi:hypothetical protein